MNCAEQIRANDPVLDGWVRASSLERDLLIREHDKRVEEYAELERLLPHGLELSALRNAVSMLRDKGHGYFADIIEAYVARLAKAGRTGW